MENLKKVTSIFAEHKEEPIWKLRFFAIMPLLTEIDGELHFILNKRAAGVNQPGDICFPGGHQEKAKLCWKQLSAKQKKKSVSPEIKSRYWAKATSC